MKKILLTIIICLLVGFGITRVKAETTETPTEIVDEPKEDIVEQSSQDYLVNEFDNFKDDVKNKIEEIKSTQTYGIIVYIISALILLAYSIVFVKKKVTLLSNSSKDFSNYGDVAKGIKDLADLVSTQTDIIDKYKAEINDLKGELNKVKEITTKGFLTNPNLVRSGIAKEIAKIGEENENKN